MDLYPCCIQMFIIGSVLLGLLVTIWGGYHLYIALMSNRSAAHYPVCPPKHRFGVLVAARNEEAVIAGLVRSLKAQDYPAHLYDVIVIPNNCTDDTAAVARQAGARILDCAVSVRSKGEVLRFAVDRLAGEEYDAYCVFDADNVADPAFLSRMNDALCSGVQVAQGYRDSKNPYDSAISGCYSVYYWMMDRFFNQGRAAVGLSALVNGTGFVISRSLVDRLGGWNTHTISEDLEITVQCVLQGERVAWVPEAVTYDEQPLTFRESVKQRRRWSSGTIQVADRYLGRLWSRARGGGWNAGKDVAMTLLIPVYQLVAGISSLLSIVAAGFGEFPYLFTLEGCLSALGVSLLLTVTMTTAAAAVTAGVEGRLECRMWKGILLYWFFMLSWIPITVLCLFRQTTQWEPIRHCCTMQQLPARGARRGIRAA